MYEELVKPPLSLGPEFSKYVRKVDDSSNLIIGKILSSLNDTQSIWTEFFYFGSYDKLCRRRLWGTIRLANCCPSSYGILELSVYFQVEEGKF